MWPNLLKKSLIENFILCAVWKRMVTFEKGRGADKDNSNKCWLFLTYHMSNMTWWDLFVNRWHLHIRKAFSLLFSLVTKLQFLATYSDASKVRWTIYTVCKSRLWKPLQLKYDCTRFHLRWEWDTWRGEVKNCPFYKEGAPKILILNELILF